MPRRRGCPHSLVVFCRVRARAPLPDSVPERVDEKQLMWLPDPVPDDRDPIAKAGFGERLQEAREPVPLERMKLERELFDPGERAGALELVQDRPFASLDVELQEVDPLLAEPVRESLGNHVRARPFAASEDEARTARRRPWCREDSHSR